MMKLITSLCTATFLFLTITGPLQAQSEANNHEITLLGGIIQPMMLQGGNFEVDYHTDQWVFGYSHGFSLDMESATETTVGDVKNQSLALHLPYSTGFGVGYRLNRFFNVRFEPKLHKFEVYYDGTDRNQSTNRITNYNTVTLGLGVYFRWKPFENSGNLLKGITLSSSLRYWQNVYSSLEDGQIEYYNRVTQQREIHETANVGIANTPIIFNTGIGYSIKL